MPSQAGQLGTLTSAWDELLSGQKLRDSEMRSEFESQLEEADRKSELKLAQVTFLAGRAVYGRVHMYIGAHVCVVVRCVWCACVHGLKRA